MMPAKLRGIEDLLKRLDKLDRKVRRQVVVKALRAGAKTIAADVRARAPVDTGLLKKSVKVRAGKRKKDRIAIGVVVYGGHPTPMVAAVELGHDDQPARPFIRPAFEAHKGPVRDAALAQIKAAIEEAGR
jgi:HK97 gp10 family phage protein